MALVAVVGRPNVGKSTLFNRLTEQRQAIVHDQPGVTRDRIYGDVEWNGNVFDLVDTGGLVPRSEERFDAAIREQVLITLEEADAIIFVVDSVTGITDIDEEIAGRLRQAKQPVFVAANKADNDARRLDATEFYSLGLEHVFPISSVNGTGTGELLDAVVDALPPAPPTDEEDTTPRLAFIGRPNVGKSSLTNRLLGQNRSIVTEIAGTTRDPIDMRMAFGDREVVLVDTAGLRKRARVQENIEFYSLLRTERAIQKCDVAVLILDASQGLEGQDLRVIREAADANKGLLVVVNKWDLVDKETNTSRDWTIAIHERLGTMNFVPIEFVSALTGQRANRVLEAALRVFDERQKKVSTSALNEVIQAAVGAQSPPTYRGNYILIKYATQVHVRPPVFALYCNHPQGVKESYRRFLENKIREGFGFEGVPLTLSFRKK